MEWLAMIAQESFFEALKPSGKLTPEELVLA
jgi:hypothetical protein